MSILNHKGDYIFLALAIGTYIAVIIRFQAVPQYLLLATTVLAGFYILWGIFHHLHIHSFTWRVVLEYFLVSALALAIIATLLI